MKENIKTFFLKNRVIILFLLFTVTVLMLYWIKVGNFPKFNLSSKAEDWAGFGTFFSGTIGTIGAIFAAIYAIMTFRSQSKVNDTQSKINEIGFLDRQKNLIKEVFELKGIKYNLGSNIPDWLITENEKNDINFNSKNSLLYAEKCKQTLDYFANTQIVLRVIHNDFNTIIGNDMLNDIILREYFKIEISKIKKLIQLVKINHAIIVERNNPEVIDSNFHELVNGLKKIEAKYEGSIDIIYNDFIKLYRIT